MAADGAADVEHASFLLEMSMERELPVGAAADVDEPELTDFL